MGENQRASIRMSDDEITVFVEQQRSATIATVGPKGLPHLVAMWYAVIDGHVWIETKANHRRWRTCAATTCFRSSSRMA